MAVRPVYVPKTDTPGVIVRDVTFQWFPGFSTAQKQRSIDALHGAAKELGIHPVLEISSKSKVEFGVQLSAFHLTLTSEVSCQVFSVETAFQGSKVFENGGPYVDLLEGTSRQAKKDERLRNSGKLARFEYFGKTYPLQPRTFFYDWLYLNALQHQPGMAERLMKYQGFTDIEFNPKKSINCQAYSAALYVSILASGGIEEVMSSPETFLERLQHEYEARDQILALQHDL
ncbi:hypothetical protein [uncultured Gimesia sp.]|uniref:DarT1-associated NADAR antitoxin family protein n=1 Tax=uncultured Gimesia sp. TaxID=1678688 RepID=UPI0030DB87F2